MTGFPTLTWRKTLVPTLAAAAVLVASCDTFNMGKKEDKEKEEEFTKPKYVITINETVKYPRAQMIEKEVPTFDGRSIWVNMNHFLSSKSITAIEPVPSKASPGYFDLKLKLDRHGSLAWMNLSIQFSYKPLGLLIDGMYLRSFMIKQTTSQDESEVVIEGPFDKILIDKLVKYAPLNYKFYHPE